MPESWRSPIELDSQPAKAVDRDITTTPILIFTGIERMGFIAQTPIVAA
jgi:hypothetical protein